MRRVADGDRAAFGSLVDRFKDDLVAYLAALTRGGGGVAEAEDLAQEAFLRLYHAASRYREEGQLKAYLYRIATNLLRTERRREKRRQLLLTAFPLPSKDRCEWAPPQEEVLATEAQRQVAAAVARLPLRFRIPLVLHEIEGWGQREIAEVLGLRPGTVKSRIHRARQRLKALLESYWQGSLPAEVERGTP